MTARLAPCCLLALAAALSACGETDRHKAFVNKTDISCEQTTRQVLALGTVPRFDEDPLTSSASYLRREADIIEAGIQKVSHVTASGSDLTAQQTLMRDSRALVIGIRAEAGAMSRNDSTAFSAAADDAARAWLRVSDDALTTGVIPCGWLVH